MSVRAAALATALTPAFGGLHCCAEGIAPRGRGGAGMDKPGTSHI
jgi:hypothetical protein